MESEGRLIIGGIGVVALLALCVMAAGGFVAFRMMASPRISLVTPPRPTLGPSITPNPTVTATQLIPTPEPAAEPTPEALPAERDAYAELEARPTWEQIYADAVAANADWLLDPREVAVRYLLPFRCQRQVIETQFDAPGVVAVTEEDCRDDSVAAFRVRVELVEEGGIWRVEWAGQQFRCARGENTEGWQAALCP